MNRSAYYILRIGIGITFLWIGIMIYQDPLGWGSMIQPWAAKFIPGSLHSVMIQTAFLDMAVGLLLIVGLWTWLASLVGTVHIVIVLITLGITAITVRDIGLLAASAALLIESAKPGFVLRLWRRKN